MNQISRQLGIYATVRKEKKTRFLLLTRPLKDSLLLAKHLKKRGVMTLLQPLLCIEETPFVCPNLEGKELIFTSQNALYATVNLMHNRTLTVWCVGEKTAETARESGFINIHTAQGNGEHLSLMIEADRRNNPLKRPHYIHFSGEDITIDFEKKFPGECQRIIVYRTQPAETLRPSVHRALRSQAILGVVLYSKKTALTLKNLVDLPPSLPIFALSEAIASLFPNHPTSLFKNEDDIVAMVKNSLKT